MATMRELFSEIFAYILLFEQTLRQGEAPPSYEQVRGDVASLFAQTEATAKRQGILTQEYQDARFAVMAWIDETILNNSRWEGCNRWKAFPLQLEYYETRNAGEEFFERLDRLGAEQKEIREIYYLCLSLGFKGQYFLGMEDELRLSKIRHEQASHLPLTLEDIQDIDKITSQPYEITPPKGTPIKLPLTYYLLRAGLVLLVIVPLASLLYYWLQKPSPPPPPPPPPIVRPTEEAIQQRLSGSLECARVSVSVLTPDPQTFLVHLGGRVASEAQKMEIQTIVQSIEGVTKVQETLQIIPRPFCAVLELLEPLKHRAEAQALGLTAHLNKTGDPPTYMKDENLVVDFQTPKFASYVYVDYYTADGGVGHLLPNPQQQQHFFQPGTSFTLGEVGSPVRWKILPPFGQELITVIASQAPLFSTPRFNPETAESYLIELRSALEQQAQADIAATFYFIKTQDRP